MDDRVLFRAMGEIDDGLLLDAEVAWDRGAVRCTVHIAQWAAVAACFLLVAAAVVSWSRGWGAVPPVDPYVPAVDGGGQRPDDDTVSLDGGAALPADLLPSMELAFNDVAAAPGGETSAMFSLGAEDFVPMTYEEIMDWFGVQLPVEQALPGMALTGGGCFGAGFGVYRTGERGAYFDVNDFSFADEDGSKVLTVSLRTKCIMAPSFQDIAAGPEKIATTRVKGWDLVIFRYTVEDGRTYHHAQFSQDGVAWGITAFGLTEEELVRVLAALLEEKPATDGPVTVSGVVSMVDGRYGDFFDGQEHHYTESHDYIQVELDTGGELIVWLPGAADQYAEGDRVTVTYTGEPATIGHIWPGQLELVSKG